MLCDAEGIDVNITDNNSRTPLHWAAASAHTAVVKVLLTTKVALSM